MLITLLTLLAALVLASQPLLAQAVGNSVYSNTTSYSEPRRDYHFLNDSTIVLEVSVLMNVQADSYVAIFGVTQVAASADSANILMNGRIDGFIAALTRRGIGKGDIYVDLVSQIPTYDYEIDSRIFSRTYNEVPSGFDLKKNVHVGFTKPELLDEILLDAARLEIYDIVKVDYVIDNTERIYDSLRGAAVRGMGKKLRDMERLGVKFTAMFQTISESSGSVSPIERYSSYSAFSSTRITNIRKPVIGSTEVNQAKKPVTVYYNRLPYKEFDIVINPKIIEPAVQFTYRLAMKYVLKKS